MLVAKIIAGRIAISLVTLLVVAIAVFMMTALQPGDVATRILGRSPDPAQLEILRQRLGVDEPVATRFLGWLTRLVRGDLGESLVSGQPVADILGRRLWNSALLAAFALVLYLPIAVVPAVLQAMHANQRLDHIISALSLCILSIPDFLLATGLLLLFAAFIPILPARSTIDAASTWPETFAAISLPGFTIALVMGTYAMRYLRDSLIEVLASDYIRMARLNGISERTILWRHALPNALVPALNITSLNLTYLFGGVVVIEQVFAYPGFGQLLVGSLMQLDVPVIQATVLVAAGVYILGNIVVDLLTPLLNPRLRQ